MCHEHALYEKANYTFDGKKEALRTHLFGPDPACYCLVAETSSGLIGYTTYMKQFSTWDAYYYVYMCCLFLRPEARGLSIGLELMDRIKDYAQANGCPEIQWQTPVHNSRAISFYDRNGGVSLDKKRYTLTL
ncbi:MAG: GNAT family N-acetyltransferase [Candidatus Eisenbacteria bacterium]|uniref:GNAT family N-acetyltransferase n=1 Tax=Eiseniibacteriota bacterium TaxID=2212470 RepID=A0A7Y2E8P5_UNCEI|nr:GNAT family N-acetyltransferase [Candidatus Eisenbacteria bacterium]